ncbi:winged helix-turn-helix domain-containing protein, partial [Klebsiella pneumoniae]
YVVKPYNPGEVVARVQAVLRRVMQTPETPLLRWLGLEVDTAMMTAGVRDERGELAALVLTPTEFSLLATLMQAPVRPFSRQHLLEHCLPESDALERSVDTHVYNLRRKLETAGISGVLVNVRGVGYRFSQP